MKKHGLGRGRGGRIATAWKVFAVALVLGMVGPAIGDIVVPTPAEGQVQGVRKVKRFLIWDICSRYSCWKGYCCGWVDI